MAGALIVTAELGREDLAWFDALRRRHYPPERNRLLAHLTMFHALPPSAEAEVRARLAYAATEAAPKAMIAGLMNLGGGVAYRIVCDDLDRLREDLANGLHGMLGPQDRGGWRPHVTIQNKVAPKTARALIAGLERGFQPRPVTLRGLGLHRYAGGPWEPVAVYSFRSG